MITKSGNKSNFFFFPTTLKLEENKTYLFKFYKVSVNLFSNIYIFNVSVLFCVSLCFVIIFLVTPLIVTLYAEEKTCLYKSVFTYVLPCSFVMVDILIFCLFSNYFFLGCSIFPLQPEKYFQWFLFVLTLMVLINVPTMCISLLFKLSRTT